MNKGTIGLGFYLVITVLFSLGMVMVYNTTSARVIDRIDLANLRFGVLKQLGSALLSVGFSVYIYQYGYQKLIDLAPWLFYGTVFLLVLVFLPGIGRQLNGAYRWLHIGPISLQPSECAKVVCPLYYLYLMRKVQKWTFYAFCKTQSLLWIPLLLIIMEPDNGTAAVLLATYMVLYFLTKIPMTYWMVPMLCITLCCAVIAWNMPHVHDRIEHFLKPKKDILGKGHQPYQAKIAVGSGGLYGKGLGQSMQKYQYLPAAWSDYIAAIFAEEFGFLGIFSLICAYMILIWLGFSVTLSATQTEGYVLSAIYTFTIALQAFLNLGVVSGLLPSKGINLPFFSQGGTSLLLSLLMIGVILDIHQKNRGFHEPI